MARKQGGGNSLSFIEGGDFNYLACYAVIEEAADEGGRSAGSRFLAETLTRFRFDYIAS